MVKIKKKVKAKQFLEDEEGDIDAQSAITVGLEKKRKRAVAARGSEEVEDEEELEETEEMSRADRKALKKHKRFGDGLAPLMPKEAKKLQRLEKRAKKRTEKKLKEEQKEKSMPTPPKLSSGDQPAIDPLRVFIGGFPQNLRNQQERSDAVRERFKKFGEITLVEVPLDTKKKFCLTMAFVNYTSEEAVKKAMTQTGTELMGVKILVKPAFVPKPKKPKPEKAKPNEQAQNKAKSKSQEKGSAGQTKKSETEEDDKQPKKKKKKLKSS